MARLSGRLETDPPFEPGTPLQLVPWGGADFPVLRLSRRIDLYLADYGDYMVPESEERSRERSILDTPNKINQCDFEVLWVEYVSASRLTNSALLGQ